MYLFIYYHSTCYILEKFMQHDEDLIEQLFWEFDKARKVSGDERLAFKSKLRFYANHFLEQNKLDEKDDGK